jgi:hypothetical protein
MEPTNDYMNKILEEYYKYYLSNSSNSSLSTTNIADLFSSQSVWDVLSETYADANAPTTWQVSGTVTNVTSTSDNKFYSDNHSNHLIVNGDLLMKDYNYSKSQVMVMHNRHHDKIKYMLDLFYKFKIASGPEQETYTTYFEDLVYLNSAFKSTTTTVVMTKKGMQRCNDIYNWYESIKRTAEFIGAPRT